MLEKVKNFYSKNKYTIILITLFTIGILIRAIGISDYPNALNVDEASAGYEAYSIFSTGYDRNGNFLPIFLAAWGSGQNALLTYFIIPFIALFGLNIFSVRLPMLIISCASLFAFYYLLKQMKDKKLALIGLAFFCICPWHIMKSRWGLESNLFPDFILFFLCFLIASLKNKKKLLYYIAFVFAGLSAYAYGTSYFFLPLFIIPLLIVLILKKEITIKQAFFSLSIVFIICLPLILFVIINTFNLPQINLPFMTIPRLSVNRYEELTSVFSFNFFTQSFSNFINSIKILILQYDDLPWNALKFFGTIYIFSIFFCFLGFLLSFTKKLSKENLEIKYSYIFKIYFIICILLMFICEPNINRLNVIFIPIIYFTVVGIYLCINLYKNKILSTLIVSIYCLSFILFIPNYFSQNWDNYFTFESDLKDVVNYISTLNNKQIFITDAIKEPYIYILFYSKHSPKNFYETVEYEDPNAAFRKVEHFSNYYFSNITEINLQNSSYVYVIKNDDFNKYTISKDNLKITTFKKYMVIEQIY